jgi:beta-propeller repeat-containing protein
LVIDPPLVFSTYFGGSEGPGQERGDHDAAFVYNEPRAVAVDRKGFVYVAGRTNTLDFRTTRKATVERVDLRDTRMPLAGFVARFRPDGVKLDFATYLNGFPEADTVNAIALGPDGSIFVVGSTRSVDFPVTADAFQTTLHPPLTFEQPADGFVLKLGGNGRSVLYSTFLGGGFTDEVLDVVVGPDGSAYVTGRTQSPDFPVTKGAFQHDISGGTSESSIEFLGRESFVARLAPDGSHLIFSTFLGGDGRDEARGIALGSDRSVYVTGWTGSTDFPTTAGVFDQTHHDFPNGTDDDDHRHYDAFVTRLTPDGDGLVYSTYLGGRRQDQAFDIAVDQTGAAYVVGLTTSEGFPTTTGAAQTIYGGDGDAFVTKLSPNGDQLLYSTFLGGTSRDSACCVQVGSNQLAVVAGSTNSRGFPTTADAFSPTINKLFGAGPSSPGGDAFLVQLEADGRGLNYATFLGGTDPEAASGLAIDSNHYAYLVGETTSSDFPVTKHAFDRSFNGVSSFEAENRQEISPDAFLTKLSLIPVRRRGGR